MKETKPNYSEAIAEIEEILAALDGGDCDVDTLAARVGRAAELIALCREKLRRAEQEVDKVLKNETTDTVRPE